VIAPSSWTSLLTRRGSYFCAILAIARHTAITYSGALVDRANSNGTSGMFPKIMTGPRSSAWSHAVAPNDKNAKTKNRRNFNVKTSSNRERPIRRMRRDLH
jgi:hypothetical protein